MSFPVPPTPFELAKGKKEFRGLQKLKYFCQLCKKQCPDANGFNCHLISNNHLRNIRLFNENPEKYIEEYSSEFERGYLDLLQKKYLGKKVLANKVYQDYISDKMHTHLNATKWTALTSFIEHLERAQKIEVEWTDKGLFVQYADISVEAAAKKLEEEKKLAAKLKKEQMEKQAIDEQMEIAKKFQDQVQKQQAEEEPAAPIDLAKDHQQISFSFANTAKSANNPLNKVAAIGKQSSLEASSLQPNIVISINPNKTITRFDSSKEDDDEPTGDKRKPATALERVLENAKKLKTEKNSGNQSQSKNVEETKTDGNDDSEDHSWVTEGIVVKIKDSNLTKYFNQKGKIIRVVEPFIAEVEMISTGAKLQIDQDLLETVIPNIGNKVKILKNGPFFGKTALLESVHQDNFTASVFAEDSGVALELPFELICKAV